MDIIDVLMYIFNFVVDIVIYYWPVLFIIGLVLHLNHQKILHWAIGVVVIGLIIIGDLLNSPANNFFIANGFQSQKFEILYAIIFGGIWIGLILLTIWVGKKIQPRKYKNGWRYLFHSREEDIPLNFTPSLKKVLSPTDWQPKERWLPTFLRRWLSAP